MGLGSRLGLKFSKPKLSKAEAKPSPHITTSTYSYIFTDGMLKYYLTTSFLSAIMSAEVTPFLASERSIIISVVYGSSSFITSEMIIILQY